MGGRGQVFMAFAIREICEIPVPSLFFFFCYQVIVSKGTVHSVISYKRT